MSPCLAFLRAVNVGGRTVRMEALRAWFVELGLERVETHIASGNVLFETRSRDLAALERRIEARLLAELGFEVRSFVRRADELAAIVAHPAFAPESIAGAQALNVAFTGVAPDAAARQAVLALRSEIDEFHVHGREVWWLCRRRQSESSVSNATLEKALNQRATVRGMRTLQQLLEKVSR